MSSRRMGSGASRCQRDECLVVSLALMDFARVASPRDGLSHGSRADRKKARVHLAAASGWMLTADGRGADREYARVLDGSG